MIHIKIKTKGERWSVATWPFIWLRKGYTQTTVDHELIHCKQQLELLIIPFYLLWVIFTIFYGYRNNPFEMEAYEFEDKPHKRKRYGWITYFS